MQKSIPGYLWLSLKAALEINLEILVHTALPNKSLEKQQDDLSRPYWEELGGDSFCGGVCLFVLSIC